MQPVHVNGLVFKSGINIDGDKAEGKNTASNHAIKNRLTDGKALSGYGAKDRLRQDASKGEQLVR